MASDWQGQGFTEEHVLALHRASAASLPLSSHRLPCSQALRTRVLNHKLYHDVWGGGDCADGPEPSTCGTIGAFK